MTHLSPSELVEFVEGTLATRRAGHAEACDTCRAAAAEFDRAMQRAAILDEGVPEPSPLFWDHLSARVRDAVANERVSRTPGWLVSLRPLAPVAAAVVVLVLLSATVILRRPMTSASESIADVVRVEPGMDVDSTIDPAHGEVWEVLTAAAADLELDDARAAGMSVQPAAIDRALQRLNADELNELGRLLQSELKRSSN